MGRFGTPFCWAGTLITSRKFSNNSLCEKVKLVKFLTDMQPANALNRDVKESKIKHMFILRAFLYKSFKR